MKDVKLRKINRIKYCPKCREMVEIVMVKKDGFCPDCKEKLYSIDSRSERFR